MSRIFRKRLVSLVSSFTTPSVNSPPVIVVTPTVGSVVTFVDASVSGNPTPTLFSYRVFLDGAVAAPINTPYSCITADIGKTVTVEEVWTNSQGSVTTSSTGAIVVASDVATTGISFTLPLPVSVSSWVNGVAPDSSLSQTGSRLYYINPSNSSNPSGITDPATLADCQANMMYWNGTNIIDAQGYTSPGGVGTLYGNDPYNPSGPVNEFKTYSSVAPRSNSSTDVGGTATTIGAGNVAPTAMMRNGKSDYYFFKRGETFSLTADIAAWNARRGISATLGSMILPRGPSSAQPFVSAAYGPAAVARPRFTQCIAASQIFLTTLITGLNNVLYTGLHFDGRDRTQGTAITLVSFGTIAAGDESILLEDCWFQGGRTGINLGSGGSQETPPDSTMAGVITLRGCIVSDCFRNNSGCNGMFYGGAHGTSGLRLISTIFMRNGQSRDPTQRTSFSPDGVEVIPGDTVTSMVGGGATVVVTTSNSAGTDNGVCVGDPVTISGSSIGAFNGTFTVTATNESARTFSFANATSGSATGASYTTIYRFSSNASANRNGYISGAKNISKSETTDCVMLIGSSGWQERSGTNMIGNFFYEGYLGVGATQGVAAPSTAVTGIYTDNVLQRFAPLPITNGVNPCPGWGFLFGGGLYGSEVTRNIFSQAQFSSRDGSGSSYGLALSAYYGDTDEPYHRALTNLNIHDNIFDVVFDGPTSGAAPSAIYENVASDRTEPYGQFAFPITGTWTAGQVLTCVPDPGYTGTPSYQWNYNNTPISGETSATHTALSGELTGATGFRGLRCYVTGVNYTGVNVGIVGNTITNNVFSNQLTTGNSTRKAFGIPTGNTAPNSTNTVYATNRHYATLATAKAAEGWTDETRTLKSYLQSLGYTVTTYDGAQEFYDAVTAMGRDNMNYNVWSGKAINNHIRAGRGLSALGDINLQVTVSRSTVTAPATVFFDASSTTVAGTAIPFHEIDYEWSFGDDSSGTWTTGAQVQSRNVDYGPLTGHLYDAGVSGTKTWTCIARYNGQSVTTSGSIVVTDAVAPTEFAGTKTLLVSQASAFTCAGVTGSSTSTASTWEAVIDAANALAAAAPAGPVRVLLMNNETWTVTSPSVHSLTSPGGPYLVGKYSAAGPHTGAAKPRIQATAGYTSGSPIFPIGTGGAIYKDMGAFTLADVTLDGSLVSAVNGVYGVSFNAGPLRHSMLLRVTFDGIHALGLSMSPLIIDNINNTNGSQRFHKMWDCFSMVDCNQINIRTGSNNFNTMAYIAGHRIFFAGNSADAGGDVTGSSHSLRNQWVRKIVMKHNTFTNPGTGRHATKTHSWEVLAWGLNTGTGTGQFTASSSYGFNAPLGEFRRPYDPVTKGLVVIGQQYPIFRCTTGGLTGTVEPTWDTTIGNTTTDGAAVWTCVDPATAMFPNNYMWTSDGLGWSSAQVVYGNNKVNGKTSAWPVAFGPLDDDDYTKVYDTIIDGNLIDCSGSSAVTTRAISAWGERTTIRNNVLKYGAVSNIDGIYLGMRNYIDGTTKKSVYPTKDAWVYNNTAYVDNAAGTTLSMVKVDERATGTIVIKNNLFRTPGQGGKSPVVVAGNGVWTASNNTAAPATDNPLFVIEPPVAFADYELQPSSPVKDLGTIVPVLRDATTAIRTGTLSIGAFELSGSTLTATWTLPTLNEDGSAIGTITNQTIYYDTVSRMGTGENYANSIFVGSGIATTALISSLVASTTYYYTVTVTVSGIESNFGTEQSGVSAP